MLAHSVFSAVVEGPAPEDVKAGWVALIIFLLLAAAVAFLGRSLVKHLRTAQASKDLGLYDESPTDRSVASDDDSSAQGGPQQTS